MAYALHNVGFVDVVKLISSDEIRKSFAVLMENNKQAEIVGAEIGVYEGINARLMLAFFPKFKLYCVDSWDNIDIWTGGPKQTKELMTAVKRNALQNLSYFNGRLKIIEKRSEEACKDFQDNFFDYVYIDAEHTEEAVKRDVELWYPKVKVGGMLAGHDYGMIEVESALHDFLEEKSIPQTKLNYLLKDEQSDWWLFKEN